MAERPNFYQLLDLDPSEDDWAVIEKRLDEKKRQWSKDSSMGGPKARQEAKRNLSLIPEIRRALSDAEGRRREGEDARRRERAARDAAERTLAERIEMLSPACSNEQFDKLVREFGGIFSAEEIAVRLAKAGVRRVDDGSREPKRRAPRESLEKSLAEAVRRDLGHLGLGSLYDFLGLAGSSPADALRKRAEEIYKENLRSGRTDDRTSVSSDLAGYCAAIFADEEGKARYDNFRLLEARDAIKPQIDIAAVDGAIDTEKMEILIRRLVERGVSEADAREVLEEYADQQGWTVRREAPPAPPTPASPPRLPRLRPGASRAFAATSLAAAALAGVLFSVHPFGWLSHSVSSSAVPSPSPSPLPSPASAGSRVPASTAVAALSAKPLSPAPAAAPPAYANAASTGAAGRSAGERAKPAVRSSSGSARQGVKVKGASAALAARSARSASTPRDTPAAPLPALPEHPVVAVLAVGDPLVAGAVEDLLAADLRRDGIDVRSSQGSLRVSELVRREGDGVDVASLLPLLGRDGVHVLVLARIASLGTRELSYYGRKDVSHLARLKIDAYRVADQRPLGRGWSEKLEYSSLNAADQAEQAVQSMAADLANSLHGR